MDRMEKVRVDELEQLRRVVLAARRWRAAHDSYSGAFELAEVDLLAAVRDLELAEVDLLAAVREIEPATASRAWRPEADASVWPGGGV